jgi:hypothetical protein
MECIAAALPELADVSMPAMLSFDCWFCACENPAAQSNTTAATKTRMRLFPVSF